jgi:hypothetical protein
MSFDIFHTCKHVSSNNGRETMVMEAAGMGTCHGIVVFYQVYTGHDGWRLDPKRCWHFDSLEG